MRTGIILGAGLVIVGISLAGMLFVHEYSITSIVFIIGMVITGFAYAKGARLPEDERSRQQTINYDQIDKNIQRYNDILWGKEKQ